MTAEVAWRGEFIEVLSDRSWRFYRCIRCGGALKTPTQEGYGPHCKRRRPLDWRTERRKVLKADRVRYRQLPTRPSRRRKSPMKFTLVRPCPKCPFRKDCLPGWLGETRSSEIARAVLAEGVTFACHETVTFRDSDSGENEYAPSGDEQHCIGAILLVEKEGAANQMLQIAERLGLRDPDTIDPEAAELVFDCEGDFISHHTDEGRR